MRLKFRRISTTGSFSYSKIQHWTGTTPRRLNKAWMGGNSSILVASCLGGRRVQVSDSIICSKPKLTAATDYLFHQFGSNEDWDRLAEVTGDSEWKWSNMRQYVQKVGCTDIPRAPCSYSTSVIDSTRDSCHLLMDTTPRMRSSTLYMGTKACSRRPYMGLTNLSTLLS